MKITVNYKEIDFEKSSLIELISLYRFNPDKISVSINGDKVDRSGYASRQLHEGDVLEFGRG